MTLLPLGNSSKLAAESLAKPSSAEGREILSEESFKRTIAIERKRTERSREPFLLMLLEAKLDAVSAKSGRNVDKIASALLSCTRETDVVGWYDGRIVIGVMYTGIAVKDKNAVLGVILNKVSTTLRERLKFDQLNQISISFHFFPDDWDHDHAGHRTNPALYPDLLEPRRGTRSVLLVKRAMDILGSAFLLILLSPLLLFVAILVKLSSKGPVLFKQPRVGQYGRSFTFLKFRSMHIGNDHAVHKEFVTKLISNEVGHEAPAEAGQRMYKLKNDKRVTSLGKLLRRTSLDELPQLINVLRGDMSLVGPRPPIPYELAVYQTWHRRRVLEVKPGITGLWQVTSRSRVKFDEMVRLDLRYASSWTLWLDIEILLRTPLAVIAGSGAC